MAGTRAAIRYAKAILELAIEKNTAAVVDEDMKLIKSTIANHKELYVALKSPVIKSEDKIAVLKEVFKEASEITKGLFNILEENRRIELLQAISEKYIIQYDAYKGKQTAIVTTAVALTPELEAKVLAKVKSLTSKEVTIENKIDASIMGGFILRVGDQQFDASVASKFRKLEREFSNNLYVSQL